MKQIKSILLIDDDSITNYINVRLLKKLDIAHEIFIATNGVEGIRYLEDHNLEIDLFPILILIDINMPVMDGFEFLKKFQLMNFKNKDKIIIATLTTSTNPKDIEKIKVLGIKHYFNKPLTQKVITNFLTTITLDINLKTFKLFSQSSNENQSVNI
jgi:CheY-like chemotaxis protein